MNILCTILQCKWNEISISQIIQNVNVYFILQFKFLYMLFITEEDGRSCE